jgi:hypothetical protein
MSLTPERVELLWTEGAPPGASLRDLMLVPGARRVHKVRMTDAELLERAKEAFALAMTVALASGRDGRILTNSDVVYALARRWAPTFRDKMDQGVLGSGYQQRKESLDVLRNELTAHGVHYAAICKAVTHTRLEDGAWKVDTRVDVQDGRRIETRVTRLYTLQQSPEAAQFRYGGFVVELNDRGAALAPGRATSRRVWIAGDERPQDAPPSNILAEVPYNVVSDGPRAQEVIRIQVGGPEVPHRSGPRGRGGHGGVPGR